MIDPTAAPASKLIIVADLGQFSAYREVRHLEDTRPRLQLVAELKPEPEPARTSDRANMSEGRFPRGTGNGGISGDLSAAERLNLDAEHHRRLIGRLAGEITALLNDHAITSCALAVSAPIHKQLLDAIEPEPRAKIRQVVAANLTKTKLADLPGHFARA